MPLHDKIRVPQGLTKEEYEKVRKSWDKNHNLRQRLGYMFENYIKEYIAIRDKITPQEHNQD